MDIGSAINQDFHHGGVAVGRGHQLGDSIRHVDVGPALKEPFGGIKMAPCCCETQCSVTVSMDVMHRDRAGAGPILKIRIGRLCTEGLALRC